MLVLSDSAMTWRNIWRNILFLAGIGTLAPLVCFAQEATQPDSELSLPEYERIVERVLRCPPTQLRESMDSQLCLLIVPPGHRMDERELLAVLTSRSGKIQISLSQPDVPLWRIAGEAKRMSGGDAEVSLAGLNMRAMDSTDRKFVNQIVGSSWTELSTTVLPGGDWYMDPTRYRFAGYSFTGSTAIEVTGPGRSARRQPSKLLSWAEGLRSRAEIALRSQPAQPFAPVK